MLSPQTAIKSMKLENSLIDYYSIISIIRYSSVLTPIDTVVIAFVLLYGYNKPMIKASAKKRCTTEQVIRNSVSKLIKLRILQRHGMYNVTVII